MAWAYLYSGNTERSREEIERCIQINPKAGITVSTMALAYVCLGDYKEALKWLDHTAKLTDPLPVCSRLGYAIYHYRTGDFEQSLALLQRLNTLQFPFFILLQHSIEGHLGILSNAGAEYIRKLNGDSETIIRRFIHDEDLRVKIRHGLNEYQKIEVF